MPSKLSFLKPQYGKICNVGLLNSNRSLEDIQIEIWNHFTDHFVPNLDEQILNAETPESLIDDDFSVREGAEILETREHLKRERNNIIVGLAKERALVKGNGRILCECCNFDFYENYGEHGYNFVECHHGLPIATGGERVTRIEDLHMVCSNCHRMLHRKLPNSMKYHSITTLKNLIVTQAQSKENKKNDEAKKNR